jgi:hypothetical protein
LLCRIARRRGRFQFGECFTALKAKFKEQLKEEEQLNKIIDKNLTKVVVQWE